MRFPVYAAFAAAVLAALPAAAADIAKGRDIARQCTECHGPAGISALPGMPHLAGQSDIYLVKQIRDFRKPSQPQAGDTAGMRAEPVMSHQAYLGIDDIESVAAWYMAQPCAVPKVPIAAPPPVIVRTTCANCHGDRGVANSPLVPHIAGQQAEYLARQLRLFRASAQGTSGGYAQPAREHPLMNEFATRVSEAELAAIATWYAGQACR